MGMNNFSGLESAINSLVSSVMGVSGIWNDSHFSDLSSNIAGAGREARQVLEAANRCKQSIARFESVANEK